MTGKPYSSPLVFSGGLFCGLVFGTFLGSVVLHPNRPAASAASTSAVVETMVTVAHGPAYDEAFKAVDTPGVWTDSPMQWINAKPPYEVLGGAPLTVQTPTAQYDYATVSRPLGADIVAGETILRLDVSDVAGKVGVAMVHPAGAPLVTNEQIVTAADGKRSLFFRLRPQDLPAEFLVRNGGDASGKPGHITIRGISYAAAASLPATQSAAVRKIGLNQPTRP